MKSKSSRVKSWCLILLLGGGAFPFAPFGVVLLGFRLLWSGAAVLLFICAVPFALLLPLHGAVLSLLVGGAVCLPLFFGW